MKKKSTKNEKLKISGSFEDVLKVVVQNNPRPAVKKATKKKQPKIPS